MVFRNFLPETDVSIRIEIRLLEIAIALTILVFLFWSIFSVIAGYQLIIQAVFFVSTIVYSLIYIAQKNEVSFNIITSLYFGYSFIIMILSWLPGGGISGAILQFIILIFISGLLVLPIRGYLVFILITACTVIGFSIYEFNNPDAAVPYTEEIDRIRDISIASIITIIMLGYSLFTFKRNYLRDRESLREAIQELQVEKVRAESADKAKTQFLATISHEMRTPLNGVVGISEILSETELNAEQNEMVKSLMYSSNLLHSLISDVLDLTSIEDRKLVLNENEINLKTEINEILEIFKSKIDSKKTSLNLLFDHDSSIPEILFGDVIRVRQVLINLINNAIKFTNEGSIKIKTELLKLDEDASTIRFSVSDSGIGISKEDQEQLFTKFFRTQTAAEVEGSGLGLTISKRLVELMGGQIYFTSQLNKGSTFVFELPLKLHSESVSDIEIIHSQERLSELKILIAEDVPINQMVLIKMLNNLGIHQVDVANNGAIAVDLAINNSYDFLMMDIQMPEMNGIEAAMMLSDHFQQNIPFKIIAVTANVMKDDFELYKKSGMVDVLSKPVNLKMLSHTLNKHY